MLISISTVPAILRGPVDMTLEYRDGLTATFTCTAFGGDDAALKFDWLALDSVAGLNIDSENETTNANGTTSTITTNVLSLSDRGSEYSCQVEYVESAPGPPETAVLNIGKIVSYY